MLKKFLLLIANIISLFFLSFSYSQDIPTIRIGLEKVSGTLSFSNVGKMATDYLDMEVEGKGFVKIEVRDSTAFIETVNGLLQVTLPLRIYPNGYFINYNSNHYRGYLEISPNSWLINVLNIEEYLFSVVPSEMPAYYPLEALKAQAVASRTYALVNRGRHGEFDLCSTVHCQVYKGIRAENDKSTRAVLETMGEVAVYNNQLIKAFFHSSSGGYTEDCKYVWGGDIPYLKGVKDVDELLNDSWVRVIAVNELFEKLSSLGINVDRNFSLELEKTVSGRVYRIWLRDSDKAYILMGTTFRSLFNLPSTLFDMILEADGRILLKGRGNGHGVGLSQNGAKFLAEKGYNYKEILKYYYQGVDIAKWY